MKKNLLKAVLWMGGALVLALLFLPKFRAPGGPRPAPASPARAALPVQTITVTPQPLEESVVATGTLRADESVEMRAEVSGKLVKICFQEGALVRMGELLAAIDDTELRASLQRATYRRELAELKARRIATLIDKGGVPQQEYDIAASELNVLRAEAALIEAQLAHTEIRAPFDGVVGLRWVSEGAFVTPATRIATFQRLDRLKVDFSVPEKYAHRITPETTVSIEVAGAGPPLTGRVHAIEPQADPATRTVLVRATCPNPSGRMLSGGFASVRLGLARIPDAILVPSLALVPGAGGQSVFVVEDGQARRRVVQTGTRTESAVQIVAGLRAGDLVIVSGLQQIRAGQPVPPGPDEVRPPALAGPAAPRSRPAGAAPPSTDGP